MKFIWFLATIPAILFSIERASLYEKVVPSSVRVVQEFLGEEVTCSGFFVDPNGLVVTVIDPRFVDNFKEVSYTIITHDQKVLKGVRHSHSQYGFALLKVEGSNFAYLELEEQGKPLFLGEEVMKIGRLDSNDMIPYCNFGIISKLNVGCFPEGGFCYFYSDMFFGKQDQGAPLLNEQGKVVGLCVGADYLKKDGVSSHILT